MPEQADEVNQTHESHFHPLASGWVADVAADDHQTVARSIERAAPAPGPMIRPMLSTPQIHGVEAVREEAFGGLEGADETERGLAAVVRDEEGRIGGEVAPRLADGTTAEDGLRGEAHQDLAQDLFGNAGESVLPLSSSPSRHGRCTGLPSSASQARWLTSRMRTPDLIWGTVEDETKVGLEMLKLACEQRGVRNCGWWGKEGALSSGDAPPHPSYRRRGLPMRTFVFVI